MRRLAVLGLVLTAGAAAQPGISRVNPPATTAGAPTFTLVVSGVGFAPGSVVKFGVQTLVTSFSSTNELRAEVPARLITAAGTVQLTVESPGAPVSNPVAFPIAPPPIFVTDPALPPASAGTVYTQAIVVTGGLPPYRFEVARGFPPPGLSLDSAAGVLAGVPSQQGNYAFAVKVWDTSAASASREFAITVVRPLAIQAPAALGTATTGLPYSRELSASGGLAPYEWTLAAGSLPPGITLSSTGLLGGVATAAGTFQFSLRVRDAAGFTASQAFSLEVQARLAIALAADLQEAVAGTGFRHTLSAVGGTPPYQWRVSAGSLPPGLALDAQTGAISGVPSLAGAYSFRIEVSDGRGQTASIALSLSVTAQLAIVTAEALPPATVGDSYATSLVAAGGTPPYNWSAPAAIPPGLRFDTRTARLEGVPATRGLYAFAVQVTDSAGRTAVRQFRLEARLPAAPPLNIAGLESQMAPAQQPRLAVSLGAPYPAEITGTLALVFEPEASEPGDDPAIQFSTGARITGFRIPAQAKEAWFEVPVLALQTGTVTGRIRVSARLESQGEVLVPAPPPVEIRLPARAPVISSIELHKTAGGFDVVMTGFSNTRQLQEALFHFQPAEASDLRTTEIRVPLAEAAGKWFGGTESKAFGGMFVYRQSFLVQGEAGAAGAVTAQVANDAGVSESQRAVF